MDYIFFIGLVLFVCSLCGIMIFNEPWFLIPIVIGILMILGSVGNMNIDKGHIIVTKTIRYEVVGEKLIPIDTVLNK